MKENRRQMHITSEIAECLLKQIDQKVSHQWLTGDRRFDIFMQIRSRRRHSSSVQQLFDE
jgi:hypothetical protein